MNFDFEYNGIMKQRLFHSEEGQTTLEYILLMSIVVLIAGLVWSKFGSFMTDMYGDFNEMLSSSLTTGVCSTDCFFSGYANAKK